MRPRSLVIFCALSFASFVLLAKPNDAHALGRACVKADGTVVVKRRCNANRGESALTISGQSGFGSNIAGLSSSASSAPISKGSTKGSAPLPLATPSKEQKDSIVTNQTIDQTIINRDRTLCYAQIGEDGSIRSFGGSTTTEIEVRKLNIGVYEVSCIGSFSGISAPSDIARFATIQTGTATAKGITISTGEADAETLSTVVRTFDERNIASDFSFSILFIGELS